MFSGSVSLPLPPSRSLPLYPPPLLLPSPDSSPFLPPVKFTHEKGLRETVRVLTASCVRN